jgi:hypothetical protein
MSNYETEEEDSDETVNWREKCREFKAKLKEVEQRNCTEQNTNDDAITLTGKRCS